MLDEHAQPVLLYPWHLNDHFDLLGILQGREFVAQIPPTISMEDLVEWGARLKEASASLDGTVQVLFDNMDTGRVSQLQSLPAQLQSRPNRTRSRKLGSSLNSSRHSLTRESNRGDKTSATSPSTTRSPSSDDSLERLTPYPHDSKRPRSKSPSDCHGDDESVWKHRQLLLRPNSPGRYYRPKDSSSASLHYRPRNHMRHGGGAGRHRPHGKGKWDVLVPSVLPLKEMEIKIETDSPDINESEIKITVN